jgi:hypothetical protein
VNRYSAGGSQHYDRLKFRRLMDRPEDQSDKTLREIHALTARLTALLQEGEALRARIVNARKANVWPYVPLGFWLAPRERK